MCLIEDYGCSEEYKKWVARANESGNPDLYILETFFDTVEQYINSKTSSAAEVTLTAAMICVKKYLEDKS